MAFQFLPPSSSECDGSTWLEFGGISDQAYRTRMARPFHGSPPKKPAEGLKFISASLHSGHPFCPGALLPEKLTRTVVCRNTHSWRIRYDHFGFGRSRVKSIAASFLPPNGAHPARTPMHRRLYDWFQKGILGRWVTPWTTGTGHPGLTSALKVSRIRE
jgi:hypothetical protein